MDLTPTAGFRDQLLVKDFLRYDFLYGAALTRSAAVLLFFWAGAGVSVSLVLDEESEEYPESGLQVASDQVCRTIEAWKSWKKFLLELKWNEWTLVGSSQKFALSKYQPCRVSCREML